MRNKFFASVFLFVLCVSVCGSASALSFSDVSDYFAEKLDDAASHVSGWFGKGKKDSKPVKSDEILPKYLADEWDELTDGLSKTLKLRDKQEKLPKSTLLPFREDQKSNAQKINELLDEAMLILANGEAVNLRREATELRARTAKQRLALDELRNERITAPESSYMFWKLTKKKADSKISELEKDIARSESRLEAINQSLADEMKKIGLELDAQQTEILLNSVTGDDLLQNTIIFSNVKLIVTKLEQLSQNDTNSLEINRKYTGMYLVLNDMLIHLLEKFVQKIDQEYTPELAKIESEAQGLRKDALNKSKQTSYTKSLQA